MFAKIKDNVLIKYPYGFDELQQDNPYTRFTGDIDLKSIFMESDEHILNKYNLVDVFIDTKPDLMPFHIAILSDTPVKEGDKWVLKWSIEFVPPNPES
jgi:hypothetical protein